MKRLLSQFSHAEPIQQLEFHVFAYTSITLSALGVCAFLFARWTEARQVAALVGW